MAYPNFKIRSAEKEYLDAPHIPQRALFQNLSELDTINRLLGGYRVLLRGVKKLLPFATDQPIRILDIGSGGGDSLANIYRRFHSRYKLELTGLDLKSDCIKYANKRHENCPIEFIESDYRDRIGRVEATTFDIMTASLFCHHLTDSDLIELFIWMSQKARIGFVINDLERHPLAYHSIRILTKLFSKSYLVKHDAPLSVRRGFKRKELKSLLERAGIQNYQIEWRWAFRWLIIVRTSI